MLLTAGSASRRHFPGFCFASPMISSGAGNRPASFFEKTSLPSTDTSKMPPLPAISFESTPNSFFSSAARPAARG